ncbi:MAG: DUF4124 domain-containing protein [Halioglobus sp.]
MIGIKHLSLIALITTILAAISGPSMAGNTYYRWDDDRGNPVHSDRPPPKGTDYEVVSTGSSLVRKVSAEEGAVPADTQSAPGNEFETTDSSKPEQKKNEEFCQRAQDNLNTLESTARVRIRDDQGDYRYLSAEEKETESNKARDLMAVHCK